MIPCRSSIQRWQTTGLDSAFGIRQADTRRRTNPLERPSPRRRWEVPASTPADATASPPARRSAWRGVCRRVARPTGIGPHSPRSLRLSDRVSTSSPGAWETAGRRWPSSPAVEWMVPGWAAHSANAGPVFGKAPGPPSGPHPLRLRRQGRRHRRRRAPRYSRHPPPLRGDERPRQDHGPGNRGLPQGGDLRPRLPRIFRTGGRARRPGNGPRGPTPPTRAGPPGAAARGSVETGRDLRAGPAQGGWRTWRRLRGREYAGRDGEKRFSLDVAAAGSRFPGHREAAAGEAASSPCTAGESASTGRTGNRNPDRATATARRTYPSAEPQPRAGLTEGGA